MVKVIMEASEDSLKFAKTEIRDVEFFFQWSQEIVRRITSRRQGYRNGSCQTNLQRVWVQFLRKKVDKNRQKLSKIQFPTSKLDLIGFLIRHSDSARQDASNDYTIDQIRFTLSLTTKPPVLL